MQIEQTSWRSGNGWRPHAPGDLGERAQLVLLFGGTAVLADGSRIAEVRRAYPKAHFLGCSTAGEICSVEVHDDSLVATAVHFEHTQVEGASTLLHGAADSFSAGERLARSLSGARTGSLDGSLDRRGLVHVLVLTEGLRINGSELVAGLRRQLPPQVTVTGGLAGDGERFASTLVLRGDTARRDVVAAVGLYGDRLRVGYGSLGGWDVFGPERLITSAQGNVLYELDGKPALDLYKRYLGAHAKDLPASGLLFPLSLRVEGVGRPVVRTILAVDEAKPSMTFAGEMPVGAYAQLMKANFDRLIDGAVGAASTCRTALGAQPADLALLISCVGRKLVLKQRIEEELEGVREILGERAVLAGFYSYGEISPFTPGARCELHNQTMTVTAFTEDAAEEPAARR